MTATDAALVAQDQAPRPAQLCAEIVCGPFGWPCDCQVVDAMPLTAATGLPSHAPSSSKRTAASGDDAVRVTRSVADAPSVGAMIVGTSLGGASGVTAFDGADGALGPAAFDAVTVNVYAVPSVSPLTVIGEAEPELLPPAGVDVTV